MAMPKIGDRVRDKEGHEGVVVEVEGAHNIRVKYGSDYVGLHCMVKSCSCYDPLEVISKRKEDNMAPERPDNMPTYFKCDQCDKIKSMKNLVKIPVVIGVWCDDLKKTVRTSREKWICTKCNNELLS